MGNPEQQIADDTSRPNGSDVSTNDKQPQVDYEKRYKDTQGAYTKSQQELKAAKAKLEVLEKLTTPKVELDESTKAELEDLKFSNPEAWRVKLNTLEKEAQNKHRETLTEAERIARQQVELENRTRVLKEFQASHPNLTITDEVIKYDVPPRITNRLEMGEISFEQYLDDVADYLNQGKVIGDGNSTLNQPNLKNVGGGDTATDGSVKRDIVKDYANIVF